MKLFRECSLTLLNLSPDGGILQNIIKTTGEFCLVVGLKQGGAVMNQLKVRGTGRSDHC